jgi:hypothetical protein
MPGVHHIKEENEMAKMRAKMIVNNVETFSPNPGERLTLNAVAAKQYDETGADEDNTYARYSPSATLQITIQNPALWGQFKQGDRFYVDFTPAD